MTNTPDNRQVVAHHEAGHVVAVRALGGSATARVWRTKGGWWEGATEYTLPPLVSVPGNWRKVFGLSGLAAEALFYGATNAVVVGRYIERRLSSPETVSPEDKAMSQGYCGLDVMAVEKLLRARWVDVEATANEMTLAS